MSVIARIIAIQSSRERLADARTQASELERTGLFRDVAIFPALYWKEQQKLTEFLMAHPQYGFAERYLDLALKGQIATALSHIAVWRQLLLSDADAMVVMEDDMRLTDAVRFSDAVRGLSADRTVEWGRLYLAPHLLPMLGDEADLQEFVDDPMPYGTSLYCVTRAGAQTLLRHCVQMADAIDRLPPLLVRHDKLNGKCVTRRFVDIYPFRGSPDELEGRHELEKLPALRQKSPSEISTSPRLSDDPDFLRFLKSRKPARDPLLQ